MSKVRPDWRAGDWSYSFSPLNRPVIACGSAKDNEMALQQGAKTQPERIPIQKSRGRASSESFRLGIVYNNGIPNFISDLADDAVPWRLECFEEESILSGSVRPFRGFLIVFVQQELLCAETLRLLARVFPGAEFFGYGVGSSAAGSITAQHGNLYVVEFPMSFAFATYLVDGAASRHDFRSGMTEIGRRADEATEFFQAFVNLVESSWSIQDRKLGISLLINRILSRMDAEECSIYRAAETGSTLERSYCAGNIPDLDVFDYHANREIVRQVLETGEPYINNDYLFEIKMPFNKDSIFIRSVLCLPLHRRGEKVGAIQVLNKRGIGGFSLEDRDTLELLVNPLSVAIKGVSMFEHSERLTITDDLTKLYNYRYLTQYLQHEVRRSMRYRKKVSLLFIDVDGFKKINDTFGHLVGSRALSEMGEVFRGTLRETDIVGRYGGDEFVIVLPETPLNGAMVIAERIRKKVEDYEFVAHKAKIRLTVSLGVANCPKHTLTPEGLIKKADAAMYRAKELSKNSIKVAV